MGLDRNEQEAGAMRLAARIRRVLAAAPALLLAAAAVADDAAVVALEPITVVGKRPEPLAQVAASVTVLQREDVEARLAEDLRGLLRLEPAITVPADPHRFGASGPSLRGLGGNRVLLETDGVPAPSAFAVGKVSSTGRPFAELDLIERVEILHGPASALYGSDALAGVIATTTRDPRSLLGEDDAHVLRARAGYSAVDDGRHLGLTYAGRRGDYEGLLALGRRESGAVDLNSRSASPNPRESTTDVAMLRAVREREGPPLRLTLAWDRTHVETDVQSLLLSPGAFANTVDLRADDRYENRRLVIDQPASAWGRLDHAEWRIYWQDAAVAQDTAEQRRAAPPRAPPLALERAFRYTERMAGGELTLAHTLATATATHGLVGGIELNHSRITERRDGLQTNLLTGASSKVLLGEVMPVRDFPPTDVTRVGLYLQDDFRPGDGRFSLIPALRIDGYWLRPGTDALYAEDNPSQLPVSVEQFSVSPKLGLSWRFTGQTVGFLQYAHGFRAPPFEDVNIGLDIPQFNVRALPNPALEPERSDSLELGLRASAAALAGSASLFYSRYRDFIESRVNLGPDPETGTLLFQSRNLNRAEVWGAEATLDADLSRLLGLPTGWSARVAAAYAQGDDLERRQPLNSIEPLRSVLALRYANAAAHAGLELALTAVAAKHRVADGAIPLARSPGFATLDLTGHWRLSERVMLRIGLFNLADRSWYEWSDIRGRAANDPLLEQYRRPGRHFSVNAAVDL
jgi:hemoglobin/transferrin/lactoferrin receptor protein